MRILFIGDVFGRTGRDLVRQGLPVLAARYGIDAVIANVENAASGAGITRETGDALLTSGVDVMTTGNHVWDKREALVLHRRRAPPAEAAEHGGRRSRPRCVRGARLGTGVPSASST